MNGVNKQGSELGYCGTGNASYLKYMYRLSRTIMPLKFKQSLTIKLEYAVALNAAMYDVTSCLIKCDVNVTHKPKLKSPYLSTPRATFF